PFTGAATGPSRGYLLVGDRHGRAERGIASENSQGREGAFGVIGHRDRDSGTGEFGPGAAERSPGAIGGRIDQNGRFLTGAAKQEREVVIGRRRGATRRDPRWRGGRGYLPVGQARRVV